MRVGLVDIGGHIECTHPSGGSHFSIPCSIDDIPQWARVALQDLLDFPPSFGRTAKPQLANSLGLFSLPRRSSLLPLTLPSGSPLYSLRQVLGNVLPISTPSLTELLQPRGSDTFARFRRSLLPHHREYILLKQWRVPHSPSPAVVVFRNLEGSVRAWLHQQYPSVSADRFRVLLEACVPPGHVVDSCILDSGMCPTLSAHRSGHPIRLCDRSFLSTRHVWGLFGYRLSDPLYSVLRSLTAPQAYSMIGNGVSNHSMSPILQWIRDDPSSPISELPLWRVVTAFSGGCTATVCLRHLSPPQPFVLLCASDTSFRCRSVIRATYSLQDPVVNVYKRSESQLARGAPMSDLTLWGFPCVLYSVLNRHVTPSLLKASLSLFDLAFEYVELRRPPVFIFENVASLLCSHLRFVIDHFLWKIDSLGGYTVYLDVLCPSSFGALMTRPRLFIMVTLRVPAVP